MKNVFLNFLCLTGLVFLAGCGTTRSGVLEQRVQTLEDKVSALQAGGPSSEPVVSGQFSEDAAARRDVSAQGMTKKQIQEALKNAGYYDGAVDGKIGPKTAAAIKEFQKNMGLKVDGVPGRNTKEKLLKYLL